MNSRAKGCRGEREFRDVLREAGFLKAYRTQQYSGKTGQACDVTCPELPSIHWEVKRVQAGNPYTWVEQAENDSLSDGGPVLEPKLPIVAHKKNGKQWLAVMALDDLLTLLKETDRVK
jgi:Holliday junction resolvase